MKESRSNEGKTSCWSNIGVLLNSVKAPSCAVAQCDCPLVQWFTHPKKKKKSGPGTPWHSVSNCLPRWNEIVSQAHYITGNSAYEVNQVRDSIKNASTLLISHISGGFSPLFRRMHIHSRTETQTDWLVWIFHKVLITWDSHTTISRYSSSEPQYHQVLVDK